MTEILPGQKRRGRSGRGLFDILDVQISVPQPLRNGPPGSLLVGVSIICRRLFQFETSYDKCVKKGLTSYDK